MFAPLNDDETLKLSRSCLVRVFAPGEAIVRKGKEGGSMFVVHRGSVKIQLIENNVARTIANLSEGNIFGEMGLFTGEPRSADVIATEETEVLEINHIAVKPLFEDNPNLVEALSKTIAKRRMELSQKSEENKEMDEMETSGIFDSIKKFFGIN